MPHERARANHYQSLHNTWQKFYQIVALDKQGSVNSLSTTISLPNTLCRTLNKVFVECQLTVGKKKSLWRRYVMVTEPLSSVKPQTLDKGSSSEPSRSGRGAIMA